MIKGTNVPDLVVILLATLVGVLISIGVFGKGFDTANYERIFWEINHYSPGIWEVRYEPFFNMFVQLFSGPQSSPAYITLIIVLPALLAKVFAVKMAQGNIAVYLLIYLSLWAPTFEQNQIRVAAGLGIFMIANTAFRDRLALSLALGIASIGFHYSMIGFVLVQWVVTLGKFNLTPARKAFLVLVLALVGLYFLYFFSLRVLPRLERMIEVRNPQSIRVFSIFSIYVILATAFSCTYLARVGLRNVPPLVLISVFAAILGLVFFFANSQGSAAYAYRVLETMTGLLPFALAWIWSNAIRKEWQIFVLGFVVVAVLAAPEFWSDRLL